MMPLTNVGGIVRNLLGTICGGGKLVCFPAFFAAVFWDCVVPHAITWYSNRFAKPARPGAPIFWTLYAPGVEIPTPGV